MARRKVTRRKIDKRAAAEAAAAALPKTAQSSIATKSKRDLQNGRGEREVQESLGARIGDAIAYLGSLRFGNTQKSDKGEALSVVKARRRWRIGVLSFLLVVILGILGVGSIYRSNLFAIEFLNIRGVSHLTASEMTTLAAIPEDTTLLRVDTEQIRDRLLSDAWVQDVQIQRILPNTLEITVTEREIAAVVEISNTDASATRRWAISADGMWLMPIPDRDSEAGKLVSASIYEDIEHVLTITDVPYSDQPDIGTYSNDQYVNCALAIVNNLSTSLVDMIEVVVANNTASTTLVLDSGVEVVFGDDTNVRLKEQVCLQLLEKYNGKIVYINVSVPDNTTYRAL